jgi:AraC-like DNA-binding protein
MIKAGPNLVKMMARSDMFREYETAFVELTGLPIALCPTENWQLPFHGQRAENPFCAMIAAHNKACAACLRFQSDLYRRAVHASAVANCRFGLYEIAVPVEQGNQTIGFLQSGQFLKEAPGSSKLKKLDANLKEMGMSLNSHHLARAYETSPLISKQKLDATLYFLAIFANHLETKSNQIAISQSGTEPLMVARARRYINEHLTEKLSLGGVARAVGANIFHFCKVFRTVTNIHFTEFVSRVRIERAKGLLPNHQLQIGEIAYRVGFRSLTHFNRMFRRITGESPTSYRHEAGKLSALLRKPPGPLPMPRLNGPFGRKTKGMERPGRARFHP